MICSNGPKKHHISIRSRRLSAGEYNANRVGGSVICFNPLPPTVGGRMACVAGTASRLTVSIRSRRLSAGESDPAWSVRGPPCFNPLPPTVGGRMQRATVQMNFQSFQSAPADCRRESGAARVRWWIARFQSAPADCRRENALPPRRRLPHVVSIRSRRLSAGE